MDFYFCESCGKRITDKEIAAGEGKNKNLKGVYCKTCAIGVSTMNTLPMTDQEAQSLLKKQPPAKNSRQKSTQTTIKRNPRRSSALQIPSASPKDTSGKSQRQPTQSTGTPPWIPILSSIAIALIALTIGLSLSGPSSKKKNEKRASAKPSSSPAIKETKIDKAKSQKAPPPAAPPRPAASDEDLALDRLNTTLKTLATDAFKERINATQTFLTLYPTTSAAASLNAKLAQWNNALKIKLKKTQPKSTEAPTPKPTPTPLPPDMQTTTSKAEAPLRTSEFKTRFLVQFKSFMAAYAKQDFQACSTIAKKLAGDSQMEAWKPSGEYLSNVLTYQSQSNSLRQAALKNLVGKVANLNTKQGKHHKGRIVKIKNEKISIQLEYTINRKTKLGPIVTIPIKSLSPQTMIKLIPETPPASEIEWAHKLLNALAKKDLKGIQESLKACHNTPLAAPVSMYFANINKEIREENAKTAWSHILARSKTPSSENRIAPESELAAFEKEYASTAFYIQHESEIEQLRQTLTGQKRYSLAIMNRLLHGQLGKYDTRDGTIQAYYDFSNPLQALDFPNSDPTKMKPLKGALLVSNKLKKRTHLNKFKPDHFKIKFTMSKESADAQKFSMIFFFGKAPGYAVYFNPTQLIIERYSNTKLFKSGTPDQEIKSEAFQRMDPQEFTIQLQDSTLTIQTGKKAILSTSIPSEPKGAHFGFVNSGRNETLFKIEKLLLEAVPDQDWVDMALLAEQINASKGPENIFTNASGDKKWSRAENWSLKRTPQKGDSVRFGGILSSDCLIEAGSMAQDLRSIQTDKNFTGRLLFAPQFSENSSQALTLTGPFLLLGGEIVFSSDVEGSGLTAKGTGATLKASGLVLGSNASLHCDNLGFPAGSGPGFNNNGGSHGGRGKSDDRYGSSKQPITLGSGGQHGNGGGAIKVDVGSGEIKINGRISANCTSNPARGHFASGSGGSIWLICNTLSGSGTVQANAGNSSGGFRISGGGRIALDYKESTFTGSLSARGGGDRPHLHQTSAGTVILPEHADWIISKEVGLAPGTYKFGRIIIKNNGCLFFHSDFKKGIGVILEAKQFIIEKGGRIKADSEGFPSKTGPGAAPHHQGGTHGGIGSRSPAKSYGHKIKPVALGSGGFQTKGGGALWLNVPNGTIQHFGQISANGQNGGGHWASGAAGGSILITCKELTGDGSIQANGGSNASNNAGAGGGGRISIGAKQNDFKGKISASAGSISNGAKPATDGTVMIWK